MAGLEEPETALHPGASEIVTDVLLLASRRVQVLVTTHSPEILDHKGVQDQHLLAVTSDRGRTKVARIGAVARSALRSHLYRPGELLSLGQLESDDETRAASAHQLSLFSSGID